MKAMILSNFSLDAVARGQEALAKLVELAFAPHKEATHWKRDPGANTITLYWGKGDVHDDSTVELPVSLPWEGAAHLLGIALEKGKPSGVKPDIDGSVVPAFRVLAGDALDRHLDDGWNYAIVAVQPVWGLIGK